MNSLGGLKCCMCFSSLVDFVMLSCNHTICGECISNFIQEQSSITTIPCPCGVTTNIPKLKNTQISSVFMRTRSSIPSMPSFLKNRTQILDRSQFAIGEQSVSRISSKASKINKKLSHQFYNQIKQAKGNCSLGGYLLNQLGNQIKFTELRFKRYLNQINRFYSRLMVDLNKRYELLKLSITQTCRSKIQGGQIKCLSSIQSTIQRIFKPQLENKLIKISQQLSKFVHSFAVSEEQSKTNENKENNGNNENSLNNNNRIQCAKSSSLSKRNRHDSCKAIKYIGTEHKFKLQSAKESKIRKKKIKNDKYFFID